MTGAKRGTKLGLDGVPDGGQTGLDGVADGRIIYF
jgi:hypothetical protein